MSVILRQTYAAPGRGPAGLAWDGAALWHADYRDGQLYALDPETAAVGRLLRCPGNLGGLTWDGQSLWVALYDQEMIRCVNPQTNDFDQTITLEDRGWLSGVAWDGRYLWAVAQQRGELLAVDPTTGTAGPARPAAVALGGMDFRDGYLWASAATPMRYDPTVGRFEWLAEPSYAVIQINPADGREVARYAAQHLYTGLCWVGDDLWLAHSPGLVLYRAALA